MGMPSGMELLLIFGIVVLLFGAKKIPDLAKGIGKGIKDFKKEMKEEEPTEVASEEAKKVEKTETTEKSEVPSETTKQA
ncbi:twin-arginine translocase TatA/TatE family subunit [Sulfurimonas sp. MAG313]|nr:twin-arginine translocase TatA/TatE family subunit [Sulfurimonas sp. MAG313]MDF1882082.1 twin-arginine translocase TatA/TatE family subunit [Sulfurimonas sp. MAG313]